MAINNSNRQALWGIVKDKYDFKDENDFSSYMEDKRNRRAMFNALKNDYELGKDTDEFDDLLGYKNPVPSQAELSNYTRDAAATSMVRQTKNPRPTMATRPQAQEEVAEAPSAPQSQYAPQGQPTYQTSSAFAPNVSAPANYVVQDSENKPSLYEQAVNPSTPAYVNEEYKAKQAKEEEQKKQQLNSGFKNPIPDLDEFKLATAAHNVWFGAMTPEEFKSSFGVDYTEELANKSNEYLNREDIKRWRRSLGAAALSDIVNGKTPQEADYNRATDLLIRKDWNGEQGAAIRARVDNSMKQTMTADGIYKAFENVLAKNHQQNTVGTGGQFNLLESMYGGTMDSNAAAPELTPRQKEQNYDPVGAANEVLDGIGQDALYQYAYDALGIDAASANESSGVDAKQMLTAEQQRYLNGMLNRTAGTIVNSIYDNLIAKYKDDNRLTSADWTMMKSMQNSMVFSLAKMISQKLTGTRAEAMLVDQMMAEYKPDAVDEGVAAGFGLMVDAPIFAVGSIGSSAIGAATGEAAADLTASAVGRLFGSRAAGMSVRAAAMSNPVSAYLVNASARIASSAVSQGMGFGGYEAISATSQMLSDDSSHTLWEYMQNAVQSYGGGFKTGAGLGVIGGGIGSLYNGASKIGRAATGALGFAGEYTYFTAGEISDYMEQNGKKDWEWNEVPLDVIVHSGIKQAAMLGMLKVQHAKEIYDRYTSPATKGFNMTLNSDNLREIEKELGVFFDGKFTSTKAYKFVKALASGETIREEDGEVMDDSLYKLIMENENISLDTKNKIRYIFNGELGPVGTTFDSEGKMVVSIDPLAASVDSEMRKTEDGYDVVLYAEDGETISQVKHFGSASEAKAYKRKADAQILANRTRCMQGLAKEIDPEAYNAARSKAESIAKALGLRKTIDEIMNSPAELRNQKEKVVMESLYEEVSKIVDGAEKPKDDETDPSTGTVVVGEVDGEPVTAIGTRNEGDAAVVRGGDGEPRMVEKAEVAVVDEMTPEQAEQAKAEAELAAEQPVEPVDTNEELKADKKAEKEAEQNAPFYLRQGDDLVPLSDIRKRTDGTGYDVYDLNGENIGTYKASELIQGDEVRAEAERNSAPVAEEPKPIVEQPVKVEPTYEEKVEKMGYDNGYGSVAPLKDSTPTQVLEKELERAKKDSSRATDPYQKGNANGRAKALEEQLAQRKEAEKNNNIRKNGGLIQNEESGRLEEGVSSMLDTLGRQLGRGFEVTNKLPKGASGFFDPKTNTIYIPEELVTKYGAEAVRWAAGHEVTHAIKESSKELYDRLVEAVKNSIGAEKWNDVLAKKRAEYEEFNKKLIEQGKTPESLTDDVIVEEVVAEWASDNTLRNKDFADKIIKEAEAVGADVPSVVKSVIDAIDKFIKSIKNFLANNPDNEAASRMAANLEEAKMLWQGLYNAAVAKKNAAAEKEGNGGRYMTSRELDEKYPDWLTRQETKKGGHSTQITGTTRTYEKIGSKLLEQFGDKAKDLSILDASSGKGLGTLAMREMGLNVEDVEPYPASDRKEQPTYTSYDDLTKQYDVVVSNAVLNVIPDDWRTDVITQMADAVKPGGKLVINTRGVDEAKGIKHKTELDDPSEVLTSTSYQKFFTHESLTDYVKEVLGDGWTIENATEDNIGFKNSQAIVVTRGENAKSPMQRKAETINKSVNVKGEISAEGNVKAVPEEDNGVRYSVSSTFSGAGFEGFTTTEDGVKVPITDKDGNVVIKLGDKEFSGDKKVKIEDLKSAKNSILNMMMGHALKLGSVDKSREDILYQRYADLINAYLEKGLAKNGGARALQDTWQWVGETVYKTVATNGDAQYSYSLDITRVCKKNEAVINSISELQRRLGYGITPGQIMDIYLETIEQGYQVPCPVCYVFSRYIRNGKYASAAINGMRKYGDHLPNGKDPWTAEQWLAERTRLEEENDANSKVLTKANNDVTTALKRIDEISKEITSGKLSEEEIAYKKKEAELLDKRYRDAINVISQQSLTNWINTFAIKSKNGEIVLRDDTQMPSDMKDFENHALDLRLTASAMQKYPAIQRLRKSGGAAAGKEITFVSDNELGSIPMSLDTGTPKKAPNYYALAAQADNEADRKMYLDKAEKQFAKAIVYAQRQSLRGGQRMWSWSDNIERLSGDVALNLMQMDMLGGALQSYSKQLEGINLVARMGGYVNGSLMGKGIGYREISSADVDVIDGKKYLKDGDFTMTNGKVLKTPVYESNGKFYVLEFDDVVGIDAFGKTDENGHRTKGLFELNDSLDKAGNILVGMNDIHVKSAMNDDRVFFIIPWHASGQSSHILRQMLGYLGVNLKDFNPLDYTEMQEEKDYGKSSTNKQGVVSYPEVPKKLVDIWEERKNEKDFKCGIKGGIKSGDGKGGLSAGQKHYRELRDAIFDGTIEDNPSWKREVMNDAFLSQAYRKIHERVNGGTMTNGDKKFIYPYEYWDESSTYDTASVNGDRYIEYCRRLGYKPKFSGRWKGNNYTDEGNFINEAGYWKTLIDRRMYDTEGKFQDLDVVDSEGFSGELIDPNKSREEFDITRVADDEGTQKIVDAVYKTESERTEGGMPTVDYGLNMTDAASIYSKHPQSMPKPKKPSKPKKSKKDTAAAMKKAGSIKKYAQQIMDEYDAEHPKPTDPTDPNGGGKYSASRYEGDAEKIGEEKAKEFEIDANAIVHRLKNLKEKVTEGNMFDTLYGITSYYNQHKADVLTELRSYVKFTPDGMARNVKDGDIRLYGNGEVIQGIEPDAVIGNRMEGNSELPIKAREIYIQQERMMTPLLESYIKTLKGLKADESGQPYLDSKIEVAERELEKVRSLAYGDASNTDIRYSASQFGPNQSQLGSTMGVEARAEQSIRKIDAIAKVDELKDEIAKIHLIHTTSNNDAESVRETVRQMTNLVKGKMTAAISGEIGALEIKNILSKLKDAEISENKDKVTDSILYIERTINDVLVGRYAKAINSLMATKVEKLNDRGVPVGRLVDVHGRNLFNAIRQESGELTTTEFDDEYNSTRKEYNSLLNRRRRLAKKKPLAIDKDGIDDVGEVRQDYLDDLDRQVADSQSKMMAAAKKRADDIEKNINNAYENLSADIERVNEEIADCVANGTNIPEDLQEEYSTVLPVRQSLILMHQAKIELDAANKDWQDALDQVDSIPKSQGYMARRKLAKDTARMYEELVLQKQHELMSSIGAVYDGVKTILGEGKDRLSAIRAMEVMRKKAIVADGMDDVKFKPVAITAKDKKEHDNPPFYLKWYDAAKNFLNAPMMSFDFMLQMIDQNHTNGNGKLYKRFMLDPENGATAANDRMAEGRKAFGDALTAKTKEIFGNAFKDYAALLKSGRKELGADVERFVTEKNLAEMRSNGMVDPNVIGSFATVLDVKPMETKIKETGLTKGSALYLWLTWQQADGREKMMKGGWTQDSVDAMESALGDKYIAFGRWVTDEFLPQLRREKYNPRNEEIFGISMGDTPHYFPLKIDHSQILEKGGLGEQKSNLMPSLMTPSLIKRTRNNYEVDANTDAFEVLAKYGDAMEKWYAMSPLIRDLNTLRASKAFRAAMEANEKGSFKRFFESAEVATNSMPKGDDTEINKVVGRLMSMHATGAIGFRFATALKQTLSYPAFMAYSADPLYQAELLGNVFRQISVNKLHPKLDFEALRGNLDWAMENLPSFKQRVREGDMGFEGMNDVNSYDAFTRNFAKWGMYSNKLIDKLTVAAGARAVYNLEMRRGEERGLSKEEAHRLAVIKAEICYNQSQQSSRPEFSSAAQKSNSAGVRSLLMFQNANIGYARQIRLSIWNAQKLLGREVRGEDGHRIKSKWTKAALTSGSALTAAIFGGWLPYLWNFGGNTNTIVPGLDTDREMSEEDWNAYLMSMLLGSTTAGTTIGAGVNTWAQGWEYKPIQALNAANDLYNDIKEELGEDDPVAMNIAKILLDTAARYSVGFNYDTFYNAYQGIKGSYRYATDKDAPPADLWMSILLILNTNKNDRRGWAAELYTKYGPVEYAKAYEYASQVQNSTNKAVELSKNFVKKMDADFFSAMEDAAKLKKKYSEGSISEEEYRSNPLFKLIEPNDDIDYSVLNTYDAVLKGMRANMRAQNPEGQPYGKGGKNYESDADIVIDLKNLIKEYNKVK